MLLSLWVTQFIAQSNEQKKYTKITEYEVLPVLGVNTSYSEFSPVLLGQEFIFTSDREYDIKTLGEGNWKKTNHFNLFKATFKDIFADTIQLVRIRIFDNNLLMDDHVGPIAFNKSGDEAIITIVSHKEDKPFAKSTAYPQLYKTQKIKGRWKNIEKLPFNQKGVSMGQACWSPDGKKLYFVQNTSPGTGKHGNGNIVYIERNGDSWGKITKVKELNTKENEAFPYLIDDKIYFASNRSGGLGGWDLYVSQWKNGKWSEPQNLGKTINTEADEFAMIFNVNKESGYFCSNRPGGKGQDDIYKFHKIEKTLVENQAISGVLTFMYLDGKSTEGLEVGVFDDQGNLITKATADANGKFVFKKLPQDKKYIFKMLNTDEEVEMNLNDGELILISNNKGEFVFRKLSSKSVGTLALIDEEDYDLITGEGELGGQFVFKKLKHKNPEGLEVYLIDEDGNIIQKTTTDKYGNFIFKKIPRGANYLIKSPEGEEFDILIFNKKEELIATLTKGKDGKFVYRKLKSQTGNYNLDVEEEDLVFIEKRIAITGQFVYQKLKTEQVGVLGVEVHDENQLMQKTTSTPEGDFMALNLKPRDLYKFRIEDESKLKEEPQLNITNRHHQTVAVINREDDGFYIYSKTKGLTVGDSVINVEVIQIEQTDIQDTQIIYYENNEYTLTPDDKEILDQRIKELKENPKLLIRVESYASTKGSEEYNRKLTQKRKSEVIKYLTQKGVHQSRIKALAYGEERTQEEQDEEQQRLSRKTELTLFTLKK